MVAMLALALALCNADRVVMSVAIVPLSLANGWTRSFSGIVQVHQLFEELTLSSFFFFSEFLNCWLLNDVLFWWLCISHLFYGGIWFRL